MPTTYDEWKPLANQHQYFYYTTHTEEAFMLCPGKDRFNQSMGIVTIPAGCMVRSRTGIIYGSTNQAVSVRRQYAMSTAVTMEEPKIKQNITSVELESLVTIQDKTDDVLQEAVKLLLQTTKNRNTGHKTTRRMSTRCDTRHD